MISISYAIMACNEHAELDLLLKTIHNGSFNKERDEIVILLDEYNYTDEVYNVIQQYDYIRFYVNPLNGDFSQQKNFLFSECTKRYIVNLDADEYLADYINNNIHKILTDNSDIDMFWIARINTLTNVDTKQLIANGWNVNELGHINFPDYQTRIVKNHVGIVWEGKVHERLTNYSTHSFLPKDPNYCLIHNKTFEKQIQQNKFYDTIINNK